MSSRRRRGPRRVQVTVPAAHVEVLDALAAINGRSPAEEVAAIVLHELADARQDPLVRQALRARGAGAGLHLIRGAGR